MIFFLDDHFNHFLSILDSFTGLAIFFSLSSSLSMDRVLYVLSFMPHTAIGYYGCIYHIYIGAITLLSPRLHCRISHKHRTAAPI